MLAKDIGFHRRRIDTQPPSQVKSETQAIEKRPAAQDVLESEHPHEIGQRIRWIGEHKDYRVRRRTKEWGEDFAVDVCIRVEQAEPAGGILAVRRPAGLLVCASANQYQPRTSQVRVVAVAESDHWRQGCPVLQVGCDASGTLTVPIHHDDFTRAATHDY